MSTSANHGPIEARHIELMNAVAKGLDDVFNYISNADKLDVRAMLTDVLARIEGRLHETTARN